MWFPLLALALGGLYYWYSRTYGFFSSIGVPFRRPLPFFGNILRVVCNKICVFQIVDEIYKENKDAPMVGLYHFITPKLVLKDPQLIEQILVKDSSTFMDRDFGTDPEKMPDKERKTLDMHLINLKGARWKSLRNKLSPVFSSGKIRSMLPHLDECSLRLKEHLVKEIEEGGPQEAKYEASGYTMDAIASCAFGLSFSSIDDPDSIFRKIGLMIYKHSKALIFINELEWNVPKLLALFRKLISFLSPKKKDLDIYTYIKNLISETIKKREENNIVRQDFLHHMVALHKQEGNRTSGPDEVMMEDNVICSNSFVFLVTGYETTATAISFMLYELAVNPDIQDRLYKEIVKVLDEHNGELNWDALKEMEYLEQVASETLRMHSPATHLTRVCSKPYKFPKTNVEIPAGTVLYIPVPSLHLDPRYFPDPEKFDPDRFSPENINKIPKYTYLPFGAGPRLCIAERLAKIEMKIAISRMLQNFSIKLNPKTISPLQYKPNSRVTTPIGGIWVDLSLRKKEE